MFSSSHLELITEVLTHYRPKTQEGNYGSLSPEEASVKTEQIVNDMKKALSKYEQIIVYHTLNIDMNPKPATYAQMAMMTGLSYSKVQTMQWNALIKLKDYTEQKNGEKIRDSLENCIAYYAPDYPMEDMGQEAIEHMKNRLKNKYTPEEEVEIMQILREAFVVRDFHNGKLNANMRYVHELKLSKVLNNKLYSFDMERLGDIARYSRQDFFRMGFGDRAVDNIEGALKKHKLKLKEYQPS
jgi:hypothetical protein